MQIIGINNLPFLVDMWRKQHELMPELGTTMETPAASVCNFAVPVYQK